MFLGVRGVYVESARKRIAENCAMEQKKKR